jgi:hypothetical protein
VVSWFSWAQKNKLGVERMEDLILVSGCTLVISWGAATSVENAAEISLASRALNNGGASFVWSNIQGPVAYHATARNTDRGRTGALPKARHRPGARGGDSHEKREQPRLVACMFPSKK